MDHPVERLRKIWTPGHEIEELTAQLNPQTELDSTIRHFLHAICQQYGAIRVSLDQPNVGTLRWETVHHQLPNGLPGAREVTLWVE